MNGDASAPPAPQLVLTADRPFLYFLRDQPTGAILFMAACSIPARLTSQLLHSPSRRVRMTCRRRKPRLPPSGDL